MIKFQVVYYADGPEQVKACEATAKQLDPQVDHEYEEELGERGESTDCFQCVVYFVDESACMQFLDHLYSVAIDNEGMEEIEVE